MIVASTALSGCGSGSKGESKKKAVKGDDQVVAQIDDVVITVADLEEALSRQSPFIRARYTTPEKKKEFLDNMVRFEVLAKEASRRGYDKDPQVVRMMKQQMISKLMREDFEEKLKPEDIPDKDVEAYYQQNASEFNRPDEVRVSQIVVSDGAKAKKVAAEAKALPKTDQKAFRDLVTRHSEDEDSKARGGDLTFFDRDSTQHPKAVVEAAFTLREVGDVSGPVQTEKGFHILKLTQKRPGYSRSLAEVKRQIQQRLHQERRSEGMKTFVAELRQKAKVEIFEDALAKVKVETGMAQAGGPTGDHGGAHPTLHAPPLPGAEGAGVP